MSKTTLLYKDIAPGAALDATVTAPTAQDRSALAQLPSGTVEEPAATGELNQWGMDGAFVLASEISPAFWSEAMSGADGSFAVGSEPQITITFSKQYSSVGISFRFDTATGGYCSELNIKWYQGSTLKADQDFTPNAVEYFCQKRVESYNKLLLTFKKTNLPYRYAKIDHVIFGVHRSFGMSELRKASAVNEIDLSSTKLPGSKLSWTLDSRDDIEYMFQLKQPVEVRNNDTLVGVYYIDSYKRTSSRVYPIECCDAIGVLNDMSFAGGVYSGKSAKALIAELAAPFEVEFDAGERDRYPEGRLPPCGDPAAPIRLGLLRIHGRPGRATGVFARDGRSNGTAGAYLPRRLSQYVGHCDRGAGHSPHLRSGGEWQRRGEWGQIRRHQGRVLCEEPRCDRHGQAEGCEDHRRDPRLSGRGPDGGAAAL